VKWVKRILLLLLPGAIVALLAAWLAFPWYAQSLIDRALRNRPFSVRLSGTGLPGPGGAGFRKLTASFISPPDQCISTPTTYTLSVSGGRLSWNTGDLLKALFTRNLDTVISLEADSLSFLPDPGGFLFEDRNARITMKLEIRHPENKRREFQPASISYAIRDATVRREKLQLSGLAYRVFLAAGNNWQQPVDTLTIAKLYSDGNPAPLGNFRALFGSKRDPRKPCTLILSDCSIDLFRLNALSERIEYDLKEQKTAFTLRLAEIPLNELPWFNSDSGRPITGTGRISGSIPIEFRDSTVMVRNAAVTGEAGAKIVYLGAENTPLFSVDIGTQKGMGEALKNLNAEITINSRSRNHSGIAVRRLSAELFGGNLRASPFRFDPERNETMLTLDFEAVRLPDRLKYHGAGTGTFGGTLSGSIPLTYGKTGLSSGDMRIASTMTFRNIPLGSLPGLGGGRGKPPLATGTVEGRLPLQYGKNTLIISNGTISGAKNSKLIFYDKANRPLLTFDLGGGTLLGNINASFAHGKGSSTHTALNRFSAGAFGGTLKIDPVEFRSDRKGLPVTLRLHNINALERVRLHGGFGGTMKGAISGTLPLVLRSNAFAIDKAVLKSAGGGTVTVTPQTSGKTLAERIFRTSEQTANYSFSAPEIVLSRGYDGRTVVDFTLRELNRKTQGGVLELVSPKGTLHLWQDRNHPDRVTLSDFRTGFFDGTAGIDRVEYDMAVNKAETVLRLEKIPLQKLLDLQGTKKIYATGTIRGTIPVRMHGQSFEIIDGAMNAESGGQIIYATTPEERASANQGLRTTYEALSNFLYAGMTSSISMKPEGKSAITIQLKGNNPDFQAGRPVELNIKVEQNLLDLMRSLSIASDVEQILSEKAEQTNK